MDKYLYYKRLLLDTFYFVLGLTLGGILGLSYSYYFFVSVGIILLIVIFLKLRLTGGVRT